MNEDLYLINQISPPTSNEDCLKWALSLTSPQTKEEECKLHLTKSYFKEKILSFTKKQLEHIHLKTDFFTTIPHLGDYVITKCILHNKVFPIILPSWKNINLSSSKISEYIQLIINENNEEQLKFFGTHYFKTLRETVHEQKNNNDLALNIVLEKFPGYLFQTNWSNEKKCIWIKENKHLVESLSTFIPYNLNQNILETIYRELTNSLMKTPLNQDEEEYREALILNIDLSYFSYVHQHEPEFLKRIFCQKTVLGSNKSFTANRVQELNTTRYFKCLDEIPKFFNPYKEMLLEPVWMKIRLYEKPISSFEWALISHSHQLFLSFSLHDNLKEEDKEILLAFAVGVVAHKYLDNMKNMDEDQFDEYFTWAKERIYEASELKFEKYANKALEGNQNRHLKKEFDTVGLYLKLNDNLKIDNSNTNTFRKTKI